MMKPEEYVALYAKFLAGKCTPEEHNLLLMYEEEFNIQNFHNEERIEDQEIIKQDIYLRLRAGMKQNHPFARLWSWKYAVAASLVLLSAVGLYTYRQSNHNPSQSISEQTANRNEIRAGGNRATLTLDNGKEIDLNKISNGTVYSSSDVKITKTSSGQIIYSLSPTINTPNDSLVYHTIRTPLGGEYQLILPDGTKVWLNAMSSLKFPNRFSGAKRTVELIGEAYFEVAKDAKKPFSVMARNTKVSVLGTHFNVMAYPDEKAMQTTLIEGAVSLSNAKQALLLSPGEQATVIVASENISKKRVDVEDMIAWKNGYFVFKKESISAIMSKVARWYGAEIVYQGNVENIRLGGTVSRAENIKDLLAKLELTGAVNFKVEGRKIYVVSSKKL